MKRFTVKRLCALVMAMLMALSVGVFNPVTAFAAEISVTIDGAPVAFDVQVPVNIDGRVLVPVRAVFEALGFVVGWNPDTQTATLTRDGDIVRITIDSNVFTTNEISYPLDVPAQIIGGSTLLPIRLVLESVGYGVDWDAGTNTVLITSPVTQEPEPEPEEEVEYVPEEEEEQEEVEEEEPEFAEGTVNSPFALFTALSDVPQGGSATITLGSGFTHPYSLWITGGRNITIDTNGHTLELVVSDASQAIMVNGASLTVTGGGQINVVATEVHVAVDAWNRATIYVEEGTVMNISNSGYGLDHEGTRGQLRGIRALQRSNVTVRGDITVDGFSSVRTTQGATGIRSRDSVVNLYGNITVTGAYSLGIYVSIERSTVNVSGSVTATGRESQQVLRRESPGGTMGSPGQDTVNIGG